MKPTWSRRRLGRLIHCAFVLVAASLALGGVSPASTDHPDDSPDPEPSAPTATETPVAPDPGPIDGADPAGGEEAPQDEPGELAAGEPTESAAETPDSAGVPRAGPAPEPAPLQAVTDVEGVTKEKRGASVAAIGARPMAGAALGYVRIALPAREPKPESPGDAAAAASLGPRPASYPAAGPSQSADPCFEDPDSAACLRPDPCLEAPDSEACTEENPCSVDERSAACARQLADNACVRAPEGSIPRRGFDAGGDCGRYLDAAIRVCRREPTSVGCQGVITVARRICLRDGAGFAFDLGPSAFAIVAPETDCHPIGGGGHEEEDRPGARGGSPLTGARGAGGARPLLVGLHDPGSRGDLGLATGDSGADSKPRGKLARTGPALPGLLLAGLLTLAGGFALRRRTVD